ncbi:Rieske 2Fe-2S domain-containing protein [Buchananella felis]|uniref:Rieske (2Fe-2S) protein n=1 Tax=Buchananella felis TaxID=3231492 RepID=UPI003528EFB0
MSNQKVASLAQLAPGGALSVSVANAAGEDVALAIVRDLEGGVHAISEFCTHAEVSLAEGEVEDCEVECWAHGARFNLKTGEGTMPAPGPVNVYPVTLDGDDVLVDVDA